MSELLVARDLSRWYGPVVGLVDVSLSLEGGIHGLLGPNLPDGSGPFPGLPTGAPVSGIWISK